MNLISYQVKKIKTNKKAMYDPPYNTSLLIGIAPPLSCRRNRVDQRHENEEHSRK